MSLSKLTLWGWIILGLLTKSCSSDNSPVLPDSIPQVPIPETAEIIFHQDNLIYVMDRFGSQVKQVTFEDQWTWEHVALSFDRNKIVGNHFSDRIQGGRNSKMILYDLDRGEVKPIVDHFDMAGNGGVDWDAQGFIYFAGIEALPFPNPNTIDEFKANAGANDIFRIKWDGSGLENLTNTPDHGEADVSVSDDGTRITYMATNITDPQNSFTEIWIRNADGSNPHTVFTGGPDRQGSVHDPEFSPDGQHLVFSQVNNDVPPVFPDNPEANTAHDIVILDLQNPNTIDVLTDPGPISIIPDWKDELVLYLDITDKSDPPHAGLATIKPDGTGYMLIRNGANVGKWIPRVQ